MVTAFDGAWRRDPFATNAADHLVDTEPDRWPIDAATSRENGGRPGG